MNTTVAQGTYMTVWRTLIRIIRQQAELGLDWGLRGISMSNFLIHSYYAYSLRHILAKESKHLLFQSN